MTRFLPRTWFLPIIPILCLFSLSCRNLRTTRTFHEPPPADIKPNLITYVDQDAFDAVFETALVNQDPVIIIQTDASRPDWGPRLNAWIAAWNRGGKVAADSRPRVRMQAPLSPVTVNGDTLREFRLLIDDLMKQVEDLARRGSSWWAEGRLQRRRIALLKPYSLRFHLDENNKIQLIFFNGNYSQLYPRFMESMDMHEAGDSQDWHRGMKCSCCKTLVIGSNAQRTHVRLGSPKLGN